MSEQQSHTIALKEWASAIQALADGKQIVLMRKGGIVEETRSFELKERAFYLYPTYEHQRSELLKPEYRHLVKQSLQSWSPEQATATIRLYAEVVDDLEITSQEQLDRLRHHHIWTDTFAEERLRWKKKNPLHVLILRVYSIERPVDIPVEEQYIGCKSWISIPSSSVTSEMTPVLDAAEFEVMKSDLLLSLQEQNIPKHKA
ncbi:DUF1802 family protein [Paenibacillus campi]|uniref:DUF1802 family protein n=1 Tax=Paenibacillus campi TaxID=3106031 RepID=UPI002AFE3B70|nr:DUF1802 family protein [Paenibacillus sp. SGZ-1009]